MVLINPKSPLILPIIFLLNMFYEEYNIAKEDVDIYINTTLNLILNILVYA